MATTPKLKIVYFAVRAKAEPIRMTLEFGKIPYEDVSVSQYFKMSWPEVKKAGLVPYGQLPCLDVDGQLIAQEAAIARFCADLVPGLVPSDPLERARCESIYHAGEELFISNPLLNVYRGETFDLKKKEFMENCFPRRLQNFAKLIANSGGPFTMGSKPTYADFKLYHHLSNVQLIEANAFDQDSSDTIRKFMSAVEELPGVKEYLQRRPKAVDIGTKPMLEPSVCGSRYVE
jgi:glutathione S-transferase